MSNEPETQEVPTEERKEQRSKITPWIGPAIVATGFVTYTPAIIAAGGLYCLFDLAVNNTGGGSKNYEQTQETPQENVQKNTKNNDERNVAIAGMIAGGPIVGGLAAYTANLFGLDPVTVVGTGVAVTAAVSGVYAYAYKNS
ncbi:MAG: hypothetical protein MRY79_01635 [Alphaproteobacteria bacterium]|nr:hypothetical protein [Alphaproteobacteria bacterium]